MAAGRSGTGERRVYCCSGCRLADAILRERAETGRLQQTLIRLGLAIFFAMNVMVFTMAHVESRRLRRRRHGIRRRLAGFLRYASFLFAVPVLVAAGGPIGGVGVGWAAGPPRDQRVAPGDRRRRVVCVLACCHLWQGVDHMFTSKSACMILVAVTWAAGWRHRDDTEPRRRWNRSVTSCRRRCALWRRTENSRTLGRGDVGCAGTRSAG